MTGKIILAGGSGVLGRSLSRVFAGPGSPVVILSRYPGKKPGLVREVFWNGKTMGPWVKELEGATVLVNLAGKQVNCRHSKQNLEAINRSRVDSIRVLGEALRACKSPPGLWIQAGAIGIYGDSGEEPCTEESPPSPGLLANTCALWENEWNRVEIAGIRKVFLRIGIVLSAEGGAVPLLERLVRWGLGGAAGTGNQFISWLHIEDFVSLVQWIIRQREISGIFNATAPFPVTNRQFMKTLRSVLRRPELAEFPAWMIRAGAWLSGTEADLVLTGRKVLPCKLLRAGFHFKHHQIEEALFSFYSSKAFPLEN